MHGRTSTHSHACTQTHFPKPTGDVWHICVCKNWTVFFEQFNFVCMWGCENTPWCARSFQVILEKVVHSPDVMQPSKYLVQQGTDPKNSVTLAPFSLQKGGKMQQWSNNTLVHIEFCKLRKKSFKTHRRRTDWICVNIIWTFLWQVCHWETC